MNGVRKGRRLRHLGEQGFAMPWVILLLLLALTLGAATSRGSLLDVQTTQHFVNGNQAFAAAEAGFAYSLNAINNRGVIDFKNDVIDGGMLTTAATSLDDWPRATFQIALAPGADTKSQGIITITGRSSLSAERVLRVSVAKSAFIAGAGALHLTNDAAVGSFSGTSFVVDGNNHLPDGTLDPSVPPRPAVSVRNDTVRDALVNGLSSGQKEQMLGLGFSLTPLNPSVWTTGAASTADVTRLIADILAINTGKVQTISKTNLNQSDLGSQAAPAVTLLTNASPKIAGGSTGYGILIVENDIDFLGSFDFYGWVLFKNPSSGGIKVGGNVGIHGAMWSPLPSFSGNGGITIEYCQTCLTQFADRAGLGATNGGNLPKPVVVTSWSEL